MDSAERARVTQRMNQSEEEIAEALGRYRAAAVEAFHLALVAYNARVVVDNEVFHDRGGVTEGRTDNIVQALLDSGWSPPLGPGWGES